MDIILVPGLWLDASSWEPVLPALEKAGHTAHPITLPGVGAPASQSAGIGIQDWVDAVVSEIDAIPGPVVLVGHSGGGNVVWGAAEARSERVRRVILVDTVPPPDGGQISEFEIVDGVIPFPGWDSFDAPEVADLDEQTRATAALRTRTVPAKVPTDPVRLDGTARYTVPVTLLMGQLDDEAFRAAVSQWGRYGTEFDAIADSEVVHLDSGHWPQFSQPDNLSRALVAAIR
ncbi:alpha/beta hydrolase [Microbacterium sp. CFBP9034]|uniref:alpha/beta fold hydrolase n=1 Tax=Microbacterium sp. CFBP9034 TaxID=3096540 RepID=UPI002A6B3CAA|nr:alpha/beta hydrolase [Microbacterium sp. CFBP9034]MDY0909880.1 alpha/beta hydrolase [Microbacterium sp. CFBP9034]